MTKATNKGIGGHTLPNNGRTCDWITPREIIGALGTCDLDPCCPPEMPWQTARQMIHWPNDGLAASWSGRIWLNPPYGEQTGAWLERLADHGSGTALIFARTETEMFHKFIWQRATSLLFLLGRLHFHYTDGRRAKGNAGGPSVLVAYGEADSTLLKACGLPGAFVRIR